MTIGERMNRPYDEQISALADDELSAAETGLLLRRACTDSTFGKRVGRYALIRDALHRNLPEFVNETLADRIAMALEMEPAHEGGPTSSPGHRYWRWSSPATGLGIAASVAMLAVVLWPAQQSLQNPSSPSTQQTVNETVQTVASENIRWDRLDPDVQARLNGYAITHGEQSAGRQVGIVPRHVRITVQEADQ